VIETNLFGPMHCARAVLPVFRRQGRGVLIHVGSIAGEIGQPYVPSYTISKFALRGLSEALRIELADDPGIQVCTLLPYAIDTPHFESGANRSGREPHAMPPVRKPESVARALVDLAERPRRQRYEPRYAVLGLALHAVLPGFVERTLLHALRAWHFAPRAQPVTQGNLFEPRDDEGAVHGTRPPRIGTIPLLAWLAAHFAARGGRALWPGRGAGVE
jgi:short-subunit dehydrogenase